MQTLVIWKTTEDFYFTTILDGIPASQEIAVDAAVIAEYGEPTQDRIDVITVVSAPNFIFAEQ